jgi:hypothetical protein
VRAAAERATRLRHHDRYIVASLKQDRKRYISTKNGVTTQATDGRNETMKSKPVF